MKNKKFIILFVVIVIGIIIFAMISLNGNKGSNSFDEGAFVQDLSQKCELTEERATYIFDRMKDVGISESVQLSDVEGGNGIYVLNVSDSGKIYKISIGNGAIVIEDGNGNNLYFEIN